MTAVSPSSAPSTRAPVVVLASALVAAAVFAAHLGFAWRLAVPVPAVHDEFAYLLMGDTFASGRLTNPTHPLWPHFETFHVFHQPVYQGKYPPGQGAFLALGQVLGGHPAVGVWLSMALGAGALCWMLAGLVPLGWAVSGSLLFALQARVFLQWGQSYWGGAASLLGGALLFGGLARTWRAAPRGAWAMAVGLFVLANTRPQEGLVAAVLCAPALVVLLRGASRRARARTLAPLLVAFLVTCAWTAYYDWRLTGSVLELPHDHWRARTALNAVVRAYRGSLERSLLGKLRVQQQFFVGAVAWVALPFLLTRLRAREVRYASLVVLLGAGFSVLVTRAYPHYLAPLAPVMVYLVVEAFRGLGGTLRRPAWLGPAAVALLAAAHLALAVRTLSSYDALGLAPRWARERQAIGTRLAALGGQHLVLVSYPPDHDLHEEWVYDAADIDAAPVVWARALGTDRDRALLEHFAGRRVWTLLAVPPYELAEVER